MVMLNLLVVLLLQGGGSATDHPGPVGVARFFAGVLLILAIYIGAWLFTYWISKEE
jgi:hypothetical protein